MNSHIQLLYIVLFFLCISVSACAQKPASNVRSAASNDSLLMTRPDSFWKRILSDEQYYILREKGTEKPYSGKWLMHEDTGIYSCSACGNALFHSDRKFDSHCGWPSFDEEIQGGKIKTKTDVSHGMSRTEIICARCGGHLGHLFDDGPTTTGKRYCVNSVSLEFSNAKDELSRTDTLTLGGGCFWCIEAVFEMMKGVISVESGFAGGHIINPGYEQVCGGNTGHAEVVQIVYKPVEIRLEELLRIFFTAHDPTTLNSQGADIGSQYRSVIFYKNQEERTLIEGIISDLQTAKVYENKIVTSVEKYKGFYKADISHQDYFRNNMGNAYCKKVIQPKIDKFEKIFKDRIKKVR